MASSDKPETKGQPGIASAALFGCCPACGEKTLFEGMLKFAPTCRLCALDYGHFNVGDGPAAFLTLIVGGLITVMAIVVDQAFNPPFWVHMLLWIPITAIAVIWALRVGKAALLAIEYRRRAGEGREKGK